MKFIKYYLFTFMLVSAQSVYSREISRNNYVDWILASAQGTSTSHFVQWKNPVDDACSSNRVRFSFEDKEIMSLLLAARMSGKKVGFYYELTATTSAVPGHGSDCQLVNVWFESD